MVAIKNDTSKNINFVNSTLHSEKTNELFAELFALINTNSLDPENKNLLKDVVLQKTDTEGFLDVNKNISENSLLKVNAEQKNKLEVTDSEYETAKSLIEVFYKEIGIVEPLNQTKNANPNTINQNPKSLLNKNFTTGEKKIAVENTLDSDESDLTFKNDNSKKVVLNIFKAPSSSIKIKKNEHDPKHFTENKSQVDSNSKLLKQQNEFNYKAKNSNFETAIINKKINKKNKQFKVSATDKTEHNDLVTKNLEIGIGDRKNANFAQTIKKAGENQISQKREIGNKDFSKTLETKDNQMQNKGQIFLDLLESSWGEKFSRIVKNAVNNGVNKLEIQVKPKNLGKLNLEVSVKNSVTAINIGSENQDVVSLLNDNLPKLLESIDKESKSFSSNMNNENNNSNYFNQRNERENFLSSNEISKKNKKIVENKNQKFSNHNIDVNA